jgi:hypothetical protein
VRGQPPRARRRADRSVSTARTRPANAALDQCAGARRAET